ncbi:molybdate ABC transporter permease subunit [Paenibacillus sp. CC-CFT747]|nr:molybdate ABC transporter permease subunit [Paenibacillus sp. CC-CFT747]
MEPVVLSLKINGLASVLVLLLGVTVAAGMAGKRFRGKTVLETVFLLPLVLPPTVVGFLLLMMLGRKSAVGRAIEWLWDQPIVFTWGAGVIAAVVVAFPLVYMTVKNGFEGIPEELREAARSSGATEGQIFRHITLPLAAKSLLSAYILGFARGLGEFGATVMIAGNIPGRTQTVPSAIYVAVESGHWTPAWVWSGAMIVISFVLLSVVYNRGVQEERK